MFTFESPTQTIYLAVVGNRKGETIVKAFKNVRDRDIYFDSLPVRAKSKYDWEQESSHKTQCKLE